MDPLVTDLAKQFPGIVALVVVVRYFLNHLREVEEKRQPLDRDIAQALKESTAAIALNTAVLERAERAERSLK